MKSHLLTLARYHQWATGRLLDAVGTLDDAAYRADAGLFFGSVHGTLNHLIVAEDIWHARLEGAAPAVQTLDTEIERDRALLATALSASAARWEPWIAARDEAALGADFAYRNLAGKPLEGPICGTLLHVFNHGTHHRGQVSAALTARNVAAPVMDLIYYLREPAA